MYRTLLRMMLGATLMAGTVGAGAQEAEGIYGRVLDRSGEVGFEGAVVRIEELGLEAISERDGRYRIGQLPAGSYTLTVEYLGAARERSTLTVREGQSTALDFRIGEDVTAIQNILVVGQAAGQAGALNRQRTADNLKTVVSADAIGAFPDQNVAESLQRVAGLSLARDQGEGRFVVIRGIDPAFNATTINGVRVPGPQADSRQVNLDVISSDLLESLEVNKTMTPDMDGDAVGGTVEVKSSTALDRGNSLSLRAEASYNELVEEASPKLAASFTRLFSVGDAVENLGVAAAVSWFERDFGSDNVETAGFDDLEGPGGEFPGIEEAEQRDYTITRERLSAALNFDLRASESSEFYLRTLYSDFSDDEIQRTNTYLFEDGDVDALSDGAAAFSGTTVEKLSEARTETQEILAGVFGGQHRLGLYTLDYALAYSEASEDTPDTLNIKFVGEEIDSGYSLADREQPQLFTTSANALDGGTFELDEIEEEATFTEERENSVAINLRRAFELRSAPAEWKIGAKARLREKENNIDATTFDGFGADFSLADFPDQRVDYPLGDFGLHPSRTALVDFVRANRAGFDIDSDGSAVASQSEDYDLSEDIFAAYGMLTADFGPLRVVAGARVEQTEFDASGTEYVVDEESGSGDPEFAAVRADERYTDVMPSLNLRMELGERTLARFAYSSTISRPNLAAAAPFARIEIEEDDGEFERNAELGNPDLDPLRAQNFDVSIEHYPGGIAQLSAGVFLKNLRDFFVMSDIAGTAGAFEDFDEALITLNGGKARIVGVEFGYAQRFAMLPTPFDGLLLSANLTLSDSKADLPFRDQHISLPFQSDSVANLALGYEKYGLSLRLAGTYRDDYFEVVNELDDAAQDRYVKEQLHLDFSGSYRITDHYQVYVNAVNLTDEPFYAYFADRRFASQYEEYGPTYELGFKANF